MKRRAKRSAAARVSLPRPKGTRATSRATLTITMHPRQLANLRARAEAASMSLSRYVAALLDSDAEDVPGATARTARIDWLATSALALALALTACGAPSAELDAAELDAGAGEPCEVPGRIEVVGCGECRAVERFCTSARAWSYGVCVASADCDAGAGDVDAAELDAGEVLVDEDAGDAAGDVDAAELDAGEVLVDAAADPCDPPFARCAGECVDPRVDERHCGACGVACPLTQTCGGGPPSTCRDHEWAAVTDPSTCSGPYVTTCDGTCVSLLTERDCLACGVRCPLGQTCYRPFGAPGGCGP